jgi:hypothetical protein
MREAVAWIEEMLNPSLVASGTLFVSGALERMSLSFMRL